MEDWQTAPVRKEIRAVLEFLTKFVRHDKEFGREDIEKLRAAGLTEQAIRDAMYASWCFQNLSKWMDAYDAPIHTEKLKRLASKFMWRMPYTRASVPPPF